MCEVMRVTSRAERHRIGLDVIGRKHVQDGCFTN
jgi:hypothetical protein